MSRKSRTRKSAKAAPRAAAEALRQSVRYAAAIGQDHPAPGDPVPEDMAVFRLALARRIETLLGTPRRCRAPVCRRRKICADAAMRCRREVVWPAMTPEEEASAMADVQRALKRRLAELDAEQR